MIRTTGPLGKRCGCQGIGHAEFAERLGHGFDLASEFSGVRGHGSDRASSKPRSTSGRFENCPPVAPSLGLRLCPAWVSGNLRGFSSARRQGGWAQRPFSRPSEVCETSDSFSSLACRRAVGGVSESAARCSDAASTEVNKTSSSSSLEFSADVAILVGAGSRSPTGRLSDSPAKLGPGRGRGRRASHRPAQRVEPPRVQWRLSCLSASSASVTAA